MALRGLEERHEQNAQQILRDTRTMGQRIGDFLKSPFAVSVSLAMLGVGGLFFPGFADIFLIIGLIMFVIAISRKAALPFRLPQRANAIDYNDISPTKKPMKSRGIYFFGNENTSNQELWFNNDDMRTHCLIFGSTGSGKTEALISLAYNSLLQSSGFIYVDGKGDNTLFAKLFSMVRYMGREDDMLLINFMTGARDIIGPQKNRLSNTLNPFATGSSSMLTNLVVSLMDSSSESSDADMWKGRAIAFVEALMKLLVAMRDAGHILLDANTIRQYFLLPRLEDIVLDRVFWRKDAEPVNLEGFPENITEPIDNYVYNLPGYNKEKKGKQVSQVLEQHGFITMQLTRVFTSLADTYGHILRTELAEVDLKDVVLNRRILVALLPALEKSPDELANLGKVIIASLRAMMASGLGDAVEGEYKDLVQRKPTNSPTPFLCILDEYGYYAVQGFAVVPAQARSLGFSVVFAGQDLPAFQKASKEEAASIGANTNIKICMKLEDPIETWEFFAKTAGESYVTHVSGFQANEKTVMNNYADSRGAQLEKRARVDLLDMKEQSVGEAHVFFKSRIVRMRFFFADPKPVKAMRLNQFLKVDVPDDVYVDALNKGIADFEIKLADLQGNAFGDLDTVQDGVQKIVDGLRKNGADAPAIERGVDALLSFHERTEEVDQISEDDTMSGDELNLFTSRRDAEINNDLLMVDDVSAFSEPLLDRAESQDRISYIERLLGQSDQQANNISNELINDMRLATHYPPMVRDKPTGMELAEIADNLVEHIALRKKEASQADDLDDLFDFD